MNKSVEDLVKKYYPRLKEEDSKTNHNIKEFIRGVIDEKKLQRYGPFFEDFEGYE